MESWRGIRKSGIYESFGMLGTGVYLTTFARAASRYALRDSKDYSLRRLGESIVVRCYVLNVADGYRGFLERGLSDSYTCSCDRCNRAIEDCSKKGIEETSNVEDHFSLWDTDYCYLGVFTRPNLSRPWNRVSSDEYCVKPFIVHVEVAAIVDPESATHLKDKRYNRFDDKLYCF